MTVTKFLSIGQKFAIDTTAQWISDIIGRANRASDTIADKSCSFITTVANKPICRIATHNRVVFDRYGPLNHLRLFSL